MSKKTHETEPTNTATKTDTNTENTAPEKEEGFFERRARLFKSGVSNLATGVIELPQSVVGLVYNIVASPAEDKKMKTSNPLDATFKTVGGALDMTIGSTIGIQNYYDSSEEMPESIIKDLLTPQSALSQNAQNITNESPKDQPKITNAYISSKENNH